MTNSSISKAALLAATLALAACGSDDTADYPTFDKNDSVATANANVEAAKAKAAEVGVKADEVKANVSADIDAAKAKLDAGMEAAADKAGAAKEAMSEKTSGLLATAKAKMDEAKDAAAKAVESSKEAAAEAVDGAKEMADAAVAKSKAAADAAMEKAKTAAAKTSEAANAAGDKMAAATGSMADGAKNMANSAMDSTKAAGDTMAEAAKSAKAAMTGGVALNNDKDKFSYAIGAEIAKSLDGMGDELDSEVVLAAMKQILNGGESQLNEEEVMAIRQQAMVRMQQKRAEEAQAAAVANIASSAQFMASTKAKEGVQATDSGLLYLVENAGEGEAPVATDRVEVHYRGTLPDGTEFDSSYSRGKPATFALNQVIAGWTEGLQLLKPGGKARFWIPADLAYGERGAGEKIGPNQALVFDVELLSIKAKQ